MPRAERDEPESSEARHYLAEMDFSEKGLEEYQRGMERCVSEARRTHTIACMPFPICKTREMEQKVLTTTILWLKSNHPDIRSNLRHGVLPEVIRLWVRREGEK